MVILMEYKTIFPKLNKSMVELFGDKLKKIVLYGSYAQEIQNDESDIDFFVLVDDTVENLRNYVLKYKLNSNKSTYKENSKYSNY